MKLRQIKTTIFHCKDAFIIIFMKVWYISKQVKQQYKKYY